MSSVPEQLQAFFDRAPCREAVGPLRTGAQIRIKTFQNEILTLKKEKGGVIISSGEPADPDLTVLLGEKSVDAVMAISASDVGDVGVEILRLMAHGDPAVKIRCKVHVGLFGFLRNGYLGILPLGGMKVTQFLASKGLSGIGKIKAAIDSLRS